MSNMPDEIWMDEDGDWHHKDSSDHYNKPNTRYIKAPVKKTPKNEHVSKTCKENGDNLTDELKPVYIGYDKGEDDESALSFSIRKNGVIRSLFVLHGEEADLFNIAWNTRAPVKDDVQEALSALTADDIETMQGMVKFCIERGYCMGMHEGVKQDGLPRAQTKRMLSFAEFEDAKEIRKALLRGGCGMSECPECPYCDWSFGEWADGKTKDREKIQCPDCEKKYFCTTMTVDGGHSYFHITNRLGRKPNE